MDQSQAWEEYKRTGSEKVRNGLIETYAPLVNYVASRVASGLPSNIDQSDLISYGVFGLIDAIDKFDPERGIKFETYAVTRIKGAIIDELRIIDWVPRSVRAKTRSVEQAYSKLEHSLLRIPNEAELAIELEITPLALRRIIKDTSAVGVVALDELLSTPTDRTAGETLGDTLSSHQDEFPSFHDDDIRKLLAGSINVLHEREKVVLALYYYEGLTLAEIGLVLGVTESRVCQVHTKVILRLRGQMDLLPLAS